MFACTDGGAGSEVDTMVCQVLSVLPYVPADVIRQDLGIYVWPTDVY